MSDPDPYKVLQVDPEAERDVIEAAYRRLARKYHPDVSSEPESHEKMIAINRAWEQLRDPVKRGAVDRSRQRTTGTAAWVAASDAQARTAGSVASHSRQVHTRGDPEQQGRSFARPTYTSPQPNRTAGGASTPGTWPFGMSDPNYEHVATDGQAGPRTWSTGHARASGQKETGAAGPPPGNPSGSVLNFGRFAGWSLGEIARTEIDYLEWLDRMPIGRAYGSEIDELLRIHGRRSSTKANDQGRGGPFRRR